MKIRGKTYKKTEIALFVFVVFQLIYLLIYNLVRTQYAVNFDSSEYMIQAMQIWNQKTLLIEDYYYSTMLTWDMPTFLAVIFYGITGNIFLSWGIANDILIVLFVLVTYKLCKDIGFERGQILTVFACIFAMYQFGPVDYIEELFINGALYGFRIMFMLAFMDLMVCMHKQIKSKWNIPLCVLAFGGVFLCGISTGIFAIGCCLLPILLGELWMVIMDKESLSVRSFLKKPIVVMTLAMLVSLTGVAANYFLGFSGSAASDKLTIAPEKMGSNLINIFVGLFELLGWPREQVPIASLAGGLGILAAVITLCYLGAMGLTFYLGIRGKDKLDSSSYRFTVYVIWVMLVNVALFLFADLTYSNQTFEYRYWVIVLIPLFIETGIIVKYLRTCVPVNLRQIFSLMFILTLSAVTVIKDYQCYQRTDGNHIWKPLMEQVNADAEEEDIDVIFVYSGWASSRTICAYANKTTEYLAVCNEGTDDTGMHEFEGMLKMPKWGTYVKYDRDCMELDEEKTAAILILDTLGEEREFYARRAGNSKEYPGTNHTLVMMDQNYMDFVYGVPEPGREHSRDFFNWQYEREGLVLDENGYYRSTGDEGVILSGTFTAEEDAEYIAVVEYETANSVKEEAGKLVVEITDGNGQTRSIEQSMIAGETQVSVGFTLDVGDSYTVKVIQETGTEFILKQADYYRQ